MKALAKDPEDRYPSAEAFAAEFRQAVRATGVPLAHVKATRVVAQEKAAPAKKLDWRRRCRRSHRFCGTRDAAGGDGRRRAHGGGRDGNRGVPDHASEAGGTGDSSRWTNPEPAT